MSGRGRLVLKGHGAVGRVAAAPSSAATSALGRVAPPPAVAGVKRAREPEAASTDLAAPRADDDGDSAASIRIQRTRGTGTLQSSATSVMGSGTQFLTEVRSGDLLELEGGIFAPVKFVLSNISLALADPFPSVGNARPGSGFTIVRKIVPEARVDHAAAAAAASRAAADADEASTGVSRDALRVKGAGSLSYRFEALAGGAALSREDLLQLRAAKRGDKFC